MKIGMVCRFPPEEDGIAATYTNLVKELRRKIDVVTIGTKKSDSDYKISFSSLLLKTKLQQIAEQEKLDLLHIHYIAPFYGKKYFLNLNLIAALQQKVQVVVTLHEVHSGSGGLRNRALLWIQDKIVRKAGGIIVHTPEQQRLINERYGPKVNAEVIYYGVSLKKLPRLPAAKAAKKPKNRILFFGILSKWKGLEYLVEAMKELPSCELKIVAALPPPVTAEYKDKIEKMASSSTNITLIAKRWVGEREKEAYYKWADIIALPYTWAPYQSGIATDAAAHGVPVVVTKVGSLWEMTGLFHTGEVVEPENSKALAAGIRKIMSNYRKYAKGIESYRQAASWQASARKHILLYKKIIALRQQA